jgi:hypothetical protein
MTLHEQPTDELKRQLAEGSLGERKTAVAEATLRRRRSEQRRNWLQRHPWITGILTTLGLAGVFLGLRQEAPDKDASKNHPK